MQKQRRFRAEVIEVYPNEGRAAIRFKWHTATRIETVPLYQGPSAEALEVGDAGWAAFHLTPNRGLWGFQRFKTKTIKCYDNGGRSADQYTVVFLDYPERQTGLYLGFTMDDAPSHPQGIGMTCVVKPGRHLGKLIAFKDLPEACQRAVKNLLESTYE